MKIGRAINKEIMGLWPTLIAESQPSNRPSANQTVHIFCMKFLIKRCSSPYKHNFRLNREEIKPFWRKFVSSS